MLFLSISWGEIIMDFEKFKKYAGEIILSILAVANGKADHLLEIGDLSGAELLRDEFIPKYERLYLGINTPEFRENFDKDSSAFIKLFEDIMAKNGFTKDQILEKMKIREELGEDSGAKAVRQLFQHELTEIKRRRNRLIEQADEVLKEEFKVNTELSNSVQQEEQMEIIYKLHPLRERFREIDEKLVKLEKKERELSRKLEVEWPYEIYGTITQESLKESFHSHYGKVDDEKND